MLAEEHGRCIPLCRREPVRRHHGDRRRREDVFALPAASREHTRDERPVVVDGGDEPPARIRERGRRGPPAVGGVVEDRELTGRRIGPVGGGEPAQVLGGDGEPRDARDKLPR